jgi:hypothetical protein
LIRPRPLHLPLAGKDDRRSFHCVNALRLVQGLGGDGWSCPRLPEHPRLDKVYRPSGQIGPCGPNAGPSVPLDHESQDRSGQPTCSMRPSIFSGGTPSPSLPSNSAREPARRRFPFRRVPKATRPLPTKVRSQVARRVMGGHGYDFLTFLCASGRTKATSTHPGRCGHRSGERATPPRKPSGSR